MKYLMEGLQNFADFKGRTAKKPFWMFLLFCFIICCLAGFIAGLIHLPILGSIVSLVFAVPAYTMGARRMHDIGKSGWYFFAPFYNLYLALQASEPVANQWGEVPPQE